MDKTVTEQKVRVPSGQARVLLLEAARDIFASQGFKGARTREIAERAGVSEALLYRHFGSKARLFEESILEPVNTFVQAFVDRWQAGYRPERPLEETVSDFIIGVYGLMRENRASVFAFLAAHVFDHEPSVNGGGGYEPLFSSVLPQLETIGRVEASRRGADFHPQAATRVAIAMATAMGLLDEVLFGPPEASGLTQEEIVGEMIAIVTTGTAARRKAKGSR